MADAKEKEKNEEARQAKVKKVMSEFKAGTLRSSSGEPVTDRDQAVAIAMSEAGLSKSDGSRLIVVRQPDGTLRKAVLVSECAASPGSGDNSYEGRVDAVGDAWSRGHQEGIAATYASFIIVKSQESFWRIPYTIANGTVSFGEKEEVGKVFVKKAQGPNIEVWLSKAILPDANERQDTREKRLLIKSHVKAYARRLKSGAVAQVGEHNDKRPSKKPPPVGTVWTAKARIRRITDDGKWETLATCMDTPRAIGVAAAKLTAKGYKRGLLWVHGEATGKKMLSDLDAGK